MNDVLKNSDSYYLPVYYLGFKDEKEVEIHAGSATRLYGYIDYMAVNWILGLTDWSGEVAGADYQVVILDGGIYEVVLSFATGLVPCQLQATLGDHDFISYSIKPAKKWVDKSFGTFMVDPGKTLLKIKMRNNEYESLIGIISLDNIMIKRTDNTN